jgi:hypothetical protein
MRLSSRYALLTALLLLSEVLIALHVDDWFVRPYVGDSLAARPPRPDERALRGGAHSTRTAAHDDRELARRSRDHTRRAAH